MARVVLGVAGSIAAYKSAELVRLFTKAGIEVTVVMTRAATEFITPLTLATLSNRPVTVEQFGPPVGPTAGWELSDSSGGAVLRVAESDRPMESATVVGGEGPRSASGIEHIRATREADLIVVAPATANLLGKVANGICDDALSTTLLASTVPVLFCPAMNTRMWEHPAVRANVRQLMERGAQFVDPGTGELACGEYGAGRMAEPEEILGAVRRLLSGVRRGRLLVTAGGTEEPIDPVRCISNRSSGKMGFAVAEAGRDLGYDVTVIHAATSTPPPSGVTLLPVRTAEEMGNALHHLHADFDLLVMAAAVADYRPRRAHAVKLPSGEASMRVDLVPNPDLLASLRGQREGKLTVGFALEWGGTPRERVARARRKLQEKGCDLIALNNPLESDSQFGGDTNRITLLYADGRTRELGLLSKYDAARALLDGLPAPRPIAPVLSLVPTTAGAKPKTKPSTKNPRRTATPRRSGPSANPQKPPRGGSRKKAPR
ncbi:MAG: bifunctional phosphopantothenoylcysteine decarboxylase/phosphopantothenate--cysteine ligase CoaBC [Candidatus Eisenbacteria bacterium]|nr:bifunctional phosphopantothenoylcysteine decarboxylase/phosphopantothenate--cysteine ligase CoaBC [Candidatus Eisenbacteria bacterium]